MRLVLASNGLATLGGSETYLLTLGRHLQRADRVDLGHDDPGALARVWRESWRWEGLAVALQSEVDRLRVALDGAQRASSSSEPGPTPAPRS